MTEKNLVINQKKIVYHGIFRTDELLSVIRKALLGKDYRYQEKKSEELVTSAGRVLQLELRPMKNVSQYVSLMIKIHLALDNVTEIMKEVSGMKQKFQQGDVFIAFDAWSLTDYEGRWGSKPLNFFLKGVVRKYLYKFPLEEGFTRQLVGDTAYVYGQVKNLLQSYEGKKLPVMKEEEVMKQVEQEMEKQNLSL